MKQPQDVKTRVARGARNPAGNRCCCCSPTPRASFASSPCRRARRRDAGAGRSKAILIAGPTASGKSARGTRARRSASAARSSMPIPCKSIASFAVLTARPAESGDAACAASALRHGSRRARPIPSAAGSKTRRARSREANDEGRLPILVGGTGLYFKALHRRACRGPRHSAGDSRALARAKPSGSAREALHHELAARDPGMAARLRPSDPQRIVRALEVIDATGDLARRVAGRRDATRARIRRGCSRLVIAPEREPLYAASMRASTA